MGNSRKLPGSFEKKMSRLTTISLANIFKVLFLLYNELCRLLQYDISTSVPPFLIYWVK